MQYLDWVLVVCVVSLHNILAHDRRKQQVCSNLARCATSGLQQPEIQFTNQHKGCMQNCKVQVALPLLM